MPFSAPGAVGLPPSFPIDDRLRQHGSGLYQRRQRLAEGNGCPAERHAILRTLGPGDAGLDGRQIETHHVRVLGLRSRRGVEQALLLAVALHQLDLLVGASGKPQIAQRLFVDRENSAGGTVFGRHVRDHRAVGQRQVVQSGAEVLDKLADHALLAQHLGNRQHQVGGGGTLRQLAAQPHAHYLRNQHRDRLAQHGRLGLDSAHAPAEHAKAIDHGGVRVGSDHRVRISDLLAALALAGKDHARQKFQVDLVTDAGIGRHDRQVLECLLPPAQKGVAFAVARVLQLGIQLERPGRAELIHLHRVVDHQFHRLQRIDAAGDCRPAPSWHRASPPDRQRRARRSGPAAARGWA